MTEAEARRPSLIVVTGPPGAGKTTLAFALSRAVPCPVVSRDGIKEGLVCTTGDAPELAAELQHRATDVFFDTLALLLSRGVTVIAEAAFQHRVWAPRLDRLRVTANLRIVLCELDAELALARRKLRGASDPDRVRFHPELPGGSASYDPPRLDVPTLRVDTSGEYWPALEAIIDFARG